MDPNVSTDVPADFIPVRLSNTTTLIVKFGIFGIFAIVLSTAVAFGVYLVFFKKKHRERKAARREAVSRDMEKGILPTSRHYPIGKVPRIRNKHPHSRSEGSSTAAPGARTPDLSRSSSRSSKQSSSSSQSPRRSCRVTRAPDPILDIPELPKTLTSQKLTETTTFS
ncbi:hypothetical protein L208DRAFT_1405060 [Tricholoma matsutake]|nr:hypothetical protein L208DRAFT_1405060 [Tricholoma matsutake 945]